MGDDEVVLPAHVSVLTHVGGAGEVEKDGSRVKPEFGSVFYNLNGPDQARARTHTTVAVPGATTATLGLPEVGAGGGVWIMNAGTSTAHLMIPGQ